jgi:protein gp37
MSKSTIEWTQETWNPTTGCNKISAGCKNCYAEVMSHRLQAMGQEKYKNGFNLTVHQDELYRPYTWKGFKTVFVNSMSDLFHKDVPIEFIKKVFEVMSDNERHTFQVLTKRADRLKEIHKELTWTDNIYMGVSVEDEKVMERIDLLRETGAKTKFLSCEPLIGPLPNLNLTGINWVIAGGESGHNARPVKQEWVLDIKDHCQKAGVPFFFKQWGMAKFNPDPKDPTISKKHELHAKGGCLLNGELYRETLPELWSEL